MKKIALTILLKTVSLILLGQGNPDWLDENLRNAKFPANVYYTGFAYSDVPQNKSLQKVTQQIKTEAQADLSKKIRMQVSSKSQSNLAATSANGHYNESESFINQSSTESNTEVVGVKTESYYDPKAKLVYAFAYSNKYELIGYYKSNLSVNIGQIESLVTTAQDLEGTGEKAKARQQIEMAKPLFSKVRYAQDLLTAIDPNVSQEELQQQKAESLYNLFKILIV